MSKVFIKNILTLLFTTACGFGVLYLSKVVYFVFLIIIAFLCALTGIGRKTWVPAYAKYIKQYIDIQVSDKSYYLGVAINLGGFAVAGIVKLLLYAIGG